MKKRIKEAQDAVRKVMKEFEPARDHAVGAGRELLLAMRAAIDAELNLLERACGGKERPCGCEAEEGTTAETAADIKPPPTPKRVDVERPEA